MAKKAQEPDRQQEYRDEAERLRQLPREDQRTILDMHRAVAADSKVSKSNRQEARERAEALERLLKLGAKKRES